MTHLCMTISLQPHASNVNLKNQDHCKTHSIDLVGVLQTKFHLLKIGQMESSKRIRTPLSYTTNIRTISQQSNTHPTTHAHHRRKWHGPCYELFLSNLQFHLSRRYNELNVFSAQMTALKIQEEWEKGQRKEI